MKRAGWNGFQFVCFILTICAFLLISGNILVIVLRGAKSLAQCLQSPNTRFALRLSMKTAAISTFFCFLLAVPTAYTLTRLPKRVSSPLEIALELTMSLPNIVLGLSLLILCSSILGGFLKKIGLPIVFSRNGIILAQLVINLPFAIKLVATAFRDIDPKLEKVAGLLGAGAAHSFFLVTLPLCKNALISTVLLVWSRALGEFGATLMLVGVTRMKTETLPAGIYLNVSVNDLTGALACAFLLLVISAAAHIVASLLSGRDGNRSRYGSK